MLIYFSASGRSNGRPIFARSKPSPYDVLRYAKHYLLAQQHQRTDE